MNAGRRSVAKGDCYASPTFAQELVNLTMELLVGSWQAKTPNEAINGELGGLTNATQAPSS